MSPYWLRLNLPPLKKVYTPEYFGVSEKIINKNVTDRIEELMEEEAVRILYDYYKFKTASIYYKSEIYASGGVHVDTHYEDGIKFITSSSINIVLLGGAGLSFFEVEEEDFNYHLKFIENNPNSPALDKYYDKEREELDVWNGQGWALVNPSYGHLVNYTQVPRMVLSLRNRQTTWDEAVKQLTPII